MIAECNSYWQNITCTGRIWLTFCRTWFILAYCHSTGRICSQSKVFCRSALLCRFNIPCEERLITCPAWNNRRQSRNLQTSNCHCDSKLFTGLTKRPRGLTSWSMFTLWNDVTLANQSDGSWATSAPAPSGLDRSCAAVWWTKRRTYVNKDGDCAK